MLKETIQYEAVCDGCEKDATGGIYLPAGHFLYNVPPLFSGPPLFEGSKAKNEGKGCLEGSVYCPACLRKNLPALAGAGEDNPTAPEVKVAEQRVLPLSQRLGLPIPPHLREGKRFKNGEERKRVNGLQSMLASLFEVITGAMSPEDASAAIERELKANGIKMPWSIRSVRSALSRMANLIERDGLYRLRKAA